MVARLSSVQDERIENSTTTGNVSLPTELYVCPGMDLVTTAHGNENEDATEDGTEISGRINDNLV